MIAAVARGGAIGAKGDLLCHMSADLRRFKALTTGHTVIMGRKTFASLPKGALPNRRNIVITHDDGWSADGAERAGSVEQALAMVAGDETEAFVIGGAQIYRQSIALARRLYITEIDADFPDADVFFPEIDASCWRVESSERHESDERNPYNYTFVNYVRMK